jgi:hypothetical protein
MATKVLSAWVMSSSSSTAVRAKILAGVSGAVRAMTLPLLPRCSLPRFGGLPARNPLEKDTEKLLVCDVNFALIRRAYTGSSLIEDPT